MLLGRICAGFMKSPEGSTAGDQNPFPVCQNLYRGHIYGLIQAQFGIELRNTTGDVLLGSMDFYHTGVNTRVSKPVSGGSKPV
jgi:hypothetical protein